jgi:hypothetical protein
LASLPNLHFPTVLQNGTQILDPDPALLRATRKAQLTASIHASTVSGQLARNRTTSRGRIGQGGLQIQSFSINNLR